MSIILIQIQPKRVFLRHTKEDKLKLFCINELLYNVLDHAMVPPHRIISEDEKKELFKSYNITDESQLPDINRFDPVARVLGCRPGNIVEIIRPSKTSISARYYRLCF